GTGYRLVVQVIYDPAIVSYEDLLDVYWHSIDPRDQTGQFCDKGEQFTTVIFYATEEEEILAEKSKAATADDLGEAVATRILAATDFYPADAYQQDYRIKNPYRYRFSRANCRVDRVLHDIWGRKAWAESNDRFT